MFAVGCPVFAVVHTVFGRCKSKLKKNRNKKKKLFFAFFEKSHFLIFERFWSRNNAVFDVVFSLFGL